MANIQITQLPTAGAITGTESVPIVQNGVTVQTTTGAIAASPSQPYTYLTVNQTPQLANSRALSGGTGIGLVDGGAQSTLQIRLNGASGSLEASGNGIIAKTGGSTVAPRTLTASGNGISITDGNGVSGNPTFQLTGIAAAVANMSGTGMLAIVGGSTIAGREILGTASQITVTDGNGSGNPTISIADNPVIPGTSSMTVPKGSSAQQPVGTNGQFRFNTDTQTFDGYSAGLWRQFSVAGGLTSFSAGSTGFTPSTPTSGAITLGGTLNVSSGGTGSTSLTGYLYGTGTNPLVAFATIPNAGLTNSTITIGSTSVALGSTITTFAGTSISGATNTLSNIANASLTNSAITINGSSVSLGGSVTVTATASNALTIGTGLTGTSYNGSAAVTIAIDTAVVATLTGTQTLTGKSMSGATNTFTNIPNNALTNSQITLGTTNVALGGTALTLGGLTSVAVTQDPTTALQLATKQYVDTLAASGIHFHSPVYVESPDTAGNLNATYNQPGGAGNGVGATLTNAGTQAALTIDGVLTTVGMRVLIYNQTNQTQNGVYTVTVVGTASTNWVLTRATDADTYAPFSPNSLGQGDAFFVQAGNTGAGETYICNTVGTIVFGVTNITFVQLSSAQVYSAGTGLTLTGTQFSISNTAVTAGAYGSASQVGTFTVNAQGQLTLAGNTAIAIANTQVSGLGTMSTQNANSVAVTGGAIDGTTIGATTASTVRATTVTTTGPGSPTNGAGQVYLNGATSNRVEWNDQGTGAPAFTTRSEGTKLLLYPALSGSQVDYAMGISAATLWSSVPVASSSFYFKWYGGETQVASLDGTGAFTAVGGISGGTF